MGFAAGNYPNRCYCNDLIGFIPQVIIGKHLFPQAIRHVFIGGNWLNDFYRMVNYSSMGVTQVMS